MAMELNQQDNRLVVNGYLKDKNLDHMQLKDGTDVIKGTVDVAFKDGKKHNVQRLNVFAPKTTKKGKENPSYKSVSKVENDYVAGKENPDRVHVTGQLDYNVFETSQGDMVKTLRKNASFFKRISENDTKYKNEARASVVLTITGYEDEVKKNKPTGNMIIHNLNVGYGERMNTIPNLTFNMNSLGNDISTIVDTFPKGSTVKAQIIFDDYAVVKKASKVAHGFGHHEDMDVATKFVNNAKIDYLDAEPVTGKQALNKSQITHAKKLLHNMVKDAKDKAKDKSNSKTDYKKIPDDDLPF